MNLIKFLIFWLISFQNLSFGAEIHFIECWHKRNKGIAYQTFKLEIKSNINAVELNFSDFKTHQNETSIFGENDAFSFLFKREGDNYILDSSSSLVDEGSFIPFLNLNLIGKEILQNHETVGLKNETLKSESVAKVFDYIILTNQESLVVFPTNSRQTMAVFLNGVPKYHELEHVFNLSVNGFRFFEDDEYLFYVIKPANE